MARIRKPKLQISKGVIALCMICLVTGGVVALAALSNSRQANFEVHTDLPVMLTWSVDPSDSYMRLGDVATGTLQYVNNYDVEITNLFLYITVIAPNGVNFAATDFLITFNGTAINVNWNTENPTTKFNTWPISDITGLESGSWEFTFSPLNDGTPVIDGTWTVSMYLYGDLV